MPAPPWRGNSAGWMFSILARQDSTTSAGTFLTYPARTTRAAPAASSTRRHSAESALSLKTWVGTACCRATASPPASARSLATSTISAGALSPSRPSASRSAARLLPLPDTTVATRKRMMRNYKLSEFPDPVQFIHIRCGDDILGTLDEAGIPGDKIRFVDMLCEGPRRHSGNDRARQKERAAYIASRYFAPFQETHREILGQDWRVTQSARYDETVLWFEADLFDQAILVYLLQRLASVTESTKISLICIGEFPGGDRFIGLGPLGAAPLAAPLPRREPVTRRQFALARRAWAALNAEYPRELNRISQRRSPALPFLPAAIRRYLAEYPSIRNGLSQTEQLALESIDAGAGRPAWAFERVQRREQRPFMGDWMFHAVIRGLASGKQPAIEGDHPRLARLHDRELHRSSVRLTAAGRKLLAGETDWCRLSGLARSIGGVHFRGAEPR